MHSMAHMQNPKFCTLLLIAVYIIQTLSLPLYQGLTLPLKVYFQKIPLQQGLNLGPIQDIIWEI